MTFNGVSHFHNKIEEAEYFIKDVAFPYLRAHFPGSIEKLVIVFCQIIVLLFFGVLLKKRETNLQNDPPY